MKTKEEINGINEEQKELSEEDLTQVSGGVSSANDPSGFQISERMRVQIHSLDRT